MVAKLETEGPPPRGKCLTYDLIAHAQETATQRERQTQQYHAREEISEAELHSLGFGKNYAHRGARTHDHKVKSLALYQLS